MNERDLHVVTGAFGYSGRYIAQRLLDSGHRVRTVTNSPGRTNLFGDRIEAHPFHFDNEKLLYVDSPPAGKIKLTDWVREHKDKLGARYASELARRKKRDADYAEL